jgi:4-amino-4-deoxy-L-arabinose transferase-like glycosyltransferase
VQHFVRGETGTGFSVWQNAASMGRISGIFNQPMEAGIAYSIGLTAWMYWFSTTKRIGVWKAVLLCGIVIGGAMSVSKVFILGGVPLGIFYFAWGYRIRALIRPKFIISALLIVGFLVPISLVLMSKWIGTQFFLRLFEAKSLPDRNLIAIYSAGRFGSDESSVTQLFSLTFREAPFCGFGFGAFSPLDNGYLEFFYQGGFVALFIYVVILFILSSHAVRFYNLARNECRLLFILIFLIIGAGFGAPVFTINRSSIFLWALIVLSISASSFSNKRLCRKSASK